MAYTMLILLPCYILHVLQRNTHSLSGSLVCMKSKPREQMDNEVDHKN